MPLVQTRGAASAQGFGEFAQAAAAITYIEDVFSTYLYTGTNAAQTLTNGIDLSTKGGLVWFKNRSALTGAYAGFDRHILFDNIRTGATNGGAGGGGVLRTNAATLDDATVTYLSSYNNNGVTIASNATVSNAEFINQSGTTFASWTWRKQPKYFDIQTWTGSGANRTISHLLGSVPACIFVKRTDATGDWQVYHRSLANTEYLVLNSTAAKATGATRWNSTTPTSTEFSLGTDATVNASAGTYVAYIFAHDAGGFGLTGTDNVISCGSFTSDGSGNATVTLGYEPQWILYKPSSSVGNWEIADTMRGWNNTNIVRLYPDSSAAEGGYTANTPNAPTATGFTFKGLLNTSSTYIYIAIRRGPMKVPTDATTVFSPTTYAGNGSTQTITTGVTPDLELIKSRTLNAGLPEADPTWYDRLRGFPGVWLRSDNTSAETISGSPYYSIYMDQMNGFRTTSDSYEANYSGNNYISYSFKRAPSFFDEVCYTGTGSATTFAHNLGAVPELILVKRRDTTGAWDSYSSALANTEYVVLNTTAAKATGATIWNSTTPTSSVFSVGTSTTTNASAGTYVAYLFGTAAGVSKVGSYTGTGALQTINCGFTGGARFILIKRTDSTGSWWLYDSERGISSSDDPYLFLNSNGAEVTNTNYVDTDTTGFKVTAAAPADLNSSGGNYIFLAIA